MANFLQDGWIGDLMKMNFRHDEEIKSYGYKCIIYNQWLIVHPDQRDLILYIWKLYVGGSTHGPWKTNSSSGVFPHQYKLEVAECPINKSFIVSMKHNQRR